MATPRVNNAIAMAKWPPERTTEQKAYPAQERQHRVPFAFPVLSECQVSTTNAAMPSSPGSEPSSATRVSGRWDSRLMNVGSQYTDESCAVSDH